MVDFFHPWLKHIIGGLDAKIAVSTTALSTAELAYRGRTS